jgi:hypothetical protein
MTFPPVSAARAYRPSPRAGAIAASTLAALALYLPTMSHGIGPVDQGELAAVACTLGIAHPTGYPLLTLLAHLWVKLLPLRPIVALDLLVALFTAASAGVLTWGYEHVLADWLGPRTRAAPGRARGRAGGAGTPALGEGGRAIAAACAALATVWTGTWWDQASGFEVYALHALMLALVTALYLRFVRSGRHGARFAFALGLAFSNHLTTVLLAPGFLLLGVLERGVSRRSLSALVPLAPWFALGLTPYLYLPLRSLTGPRFDWGAPHTLDRFLAHVGGWQFRVWMFAEPGTFALQSRFFFGRLPGELAWAGLAIAALGYAILLARAPRLAIPLALVFAATVIYAGGFAISEIRPYYLAAVMTLGIAMAAGLGWIGERFGTRVLAIAGVTLAVAVAASNYRASDAHDERAVEDMAHDMLEPLPRDAVVLSTQWDYWLAGSFYLQEVEGLRRDVTVIDLELLRRGWYVDELARRAPWLAARARASFDRFRREVAPFEARRPYDGAVIERAYQDMIAAIEREAVGDRPVFVTREIDPRHTGGWTRVPFGLAERLSSATGYQPGPALAWRQRTSLSRLDATAFVTAELYARAAAGRAEYEVAFGRDSLAVIALSVARRFEPKTRLEDVPPLPYHGREQVANTLAFFDRLRAVDLETLHQTARGLPPAPR